MDGARLGYALSADGNDLDLPSIAGLCDAFYIGGTKNGALFGEALVITSEALKTDSATSSSKRAACSQGPTAGPAVYRPSGIRPVISKWPAMPTCWRESSGTRVLIRVIRFSSTRRTNQQFPILPNA
jgi:threonine aldolase